MGGFISRLFGGARDDAARGAIGPNPVMEDLQRQMEKAQRDAEEAERERQRAEGDRQRAQDQQRFAEEQSARAADALASAEAARALAEEAKRMMEQGVKQAQEERRNAEELIKKADEERKKADDAKRAAEEDMRRAEENTQRVQAERDLAHHARTQAEDDARRALDDKAKAEQEKDRAEIEKRHADDAKRAAEELQKKAEDDRMRSEEERAKADEEARKARLEQEKAERAKAAADKAAADAQTALEEAERALKEGIKPVIIPTPEEFEATKKRLQYREGIFHFAIAGISGSGKSSLINAFRGLRNSSKSPLIARTGVVETTSKITRFADPNAANPFVWYDVPGAGTLDIPDWVYFNAQGLYVFDCIIVLTDNRFTQTDEAILRNCARFKIPAYIVRSKSKQHIQNVLNDMPYEDDEDVDEDARMAQAREKYITETRKSVAKNLERAELPQQRVYMIDKEALVQLIAKGKEPKDMLDESALVADLLSEARARRVKSFVQK